MGLLPKFIDDAAGPPAQSVGNTLSNLWELGVGNHVALWIKKQEVRQQQNLQDYVKKVEEKTQEIPEEFIQEPSLHIVGPAIEASKYYIESEELREMFANLIASSIDNRKNDKIHPSFVEIIKQLSVLDAQILSLYRDLLRIPIAQIIIKKQTHEYRITQVHVIDFTHSENYKSYASSLSNLQRLGLLSIDYSSQTNYDSAYDFIEDHPAFREAHELMIELQRTDPEYNEVSSKKGITTRTPLCEDFISVCL